MAESDSSPPEDNETKPVVSKGHETSDTNEEVVLSKFFFAVREPLPFPHGFTIHGRPASLSGQDPEPIRSLWAHLKIHQIPASSTQSRAAHQAVYQAFGGSRAPVDGNTTHPQADTFFTVVEVVTTFDSPNSAPSNIGGRGLDWTQDALMRAIKLLAQAVRAERVAAGSTVAIPSYEQIMNPVLTLVGKGRRGLVPGPGGMLHQATHISDRWDGPILTVLEHLNVDEQMLYVRPGCAPNDPLFGYWMNLFDLKNPLATSFERTLDARRMLEVEGQYNLAIVLTATADEVFIDAILGLCLWERWYAGQLQMEDIAKVFSDSKSPVDRMKASLSQQLGGNWSGRQSAVSRWIESVWKLRHLCVHGGYDPTFLEAQKSIEASQRLQEHILDRIAEKRNTFPRVALMALAQPGLEARGMWAGKIKKLAEETLIQEPNWFINYREFNTKLQQARFAQGN
jgi:hypothetical protein